MKKVLFTALSFLFICFTFIFIDTNLCLGENHLILDEHFDRDPRDNTWPWATAGGFSWFHNPRNWPTAVPAYSNCSWGWQNYHYSTEVIQRAENPGSIWCAYATQQGQNFPQWPDDTTYWHDMNAWAWWGQRNGDGVDLRDAVSGVLSFWYRLDLDNLSGDSLSVCLVDSMQYLTTDDTTFRYNVGIGKTYCVGTNGSWIRDEVHFDSVFVNGEQTSVIGESNVWACFVWHSDSIYIGGTGAYIDDVIFMWDDGLLDLYRDELQFGYPVTEDSIRWDVLRPNAEEQAYLRLLWNCEGSDIQTDSFDISCYIDDELFYTERRSVMGSDDTTYVTTTDRLWTAEPGQHSIVWMLDEEEEIEESQENNNLSEDLIEIEWRRPPQFAVLTPFEQDVQVPQGGRYDVEWEVFDPDDENQDLSVFMYMTKDTSGWMDDPEVMYAGVANGYIPVVGEFAIRQGTHTTTITLDEDVFNERDRVFFVGVANDGEPSHNAYAICQGNILVMPNAVEPDNSTLPHSLEISATYPNPFNSDVSIRYSVQTQGLVRMSVYDSHGRLVADLIDGIETAGEHVMNWSPGDLPGGIYLLRLKDQKKSVVSKLIYMP